MITFGLYDIPGLKTQVLNQSNISQVKLVGEGADDAGGVFDDTMTEMCQELVTGAVPLLIPTPNALSEAGNNRDRFLLNPDLAQHNHLSWFKFLGVNGLTLILYFSFYILVP